MSKARPSAPPVRMRHSSAMASSCSLTPCTDVRQRLRQRGVGHGTGSPDALQLGRLLDLALCFDEALDGHELDRRAGLGQLQPACVADGGSLHADAPDDTAARGVDRAQAGEHRGPGLLEAARQVDDAAVGTLLEGLESIARVGHDDGLVGRDEEAPRGAADLLLAIAEHEAGQVAAVLRAQAEVGIQPRIGQPGPQLLRTARPCLAVCLPPALPVDLGRCRVVGYWHLAMLRLCCAAVLAKVCVSEPGQA